MAEEIFAVCCSSHVANGSNNSDRLLNVWVKIHAHIILNFVISTFFKCSTFLLFFLSALESRSDIKVLLAAVWSQQCENVSVSEWDATVKKKIKQKFSHVSLELINF